MSFWRSTNGGGSIQKLHPQFNPFPGFPDAVTLTVHPSNSDIAIMPTHGNGVWIGYRTQPFLKAEASPDSIQTEGNLPKRFALHANFPNPFNPTTVIKYDLPKASEVRLVVYDVLGRRVRTLVEAQMSPGFHTQLWDGKDARGMALASGLYFVRLQADGFKKTHKMTLLQ